MVRTHPRRTLISDFIFETASKAARRRNVLHTGALAVQLAAKFPNSGMTLHEIEEEIIAQVGMAGGAAEMAATSAPRRAG